MLALLNGLELILLAVAAVILLVALRKLPDLWRGIQEGGREFTRASRDMEADLRARGNDPVAEALTHDNRTQEVGGRGVPT